MVYRWWQEYREGKFVASPTRRIHMTKGEAEPKLGEVRVIVVSEAMWQFKS
jgi:transposase|tara:strand:+ start:1820 stop:1972 length:153 start_codon:yes stop_codon:yes gene_type:complete